MRSWKFELFTISCMILVLGGTGRMGWEIYDTKYGPQNPCATTYVLMNPTGVGADFLMYLAMNDKVKVGPDSIIEGMDWVVLDGELVFVVKLDGIIYTTHPCYTDSGVEYRDTSRSEPTPPAVK